MRKVNLLSMSVDQLLALRAQVSAALARKADDLEQQISKLLADSEGQGRGRMRGGRPRGKGGHPLKGRKVAPKYRSKTNRTLTWSGRGAVPRWMRDEMKSSKLKREDFAI